MCLCARVWATAVRVCVLSSLIGPITRFFCQLLADGDSQLERSTYALSGWWAICRHVGTRRDLASNLTLGGLDHAHKHNCGR